jgi:hypothetical protein
MCCTCAAHVLHICTCAAHLHMCCTCAAHVLHMCCTCATHLHMCCTSTHVLHMCCTCAAHMCCTSAHVRLIWLSWLMSLLITHSLENKNVNNFPRDSGESLWLPVAPEGNHRVTGEIVYIFVLNIVNTFGIWHKQTVDCMWYIQVICMHACIVGNHY